MTLLDTLRSALASDAATDRPAGIEIRQDLEPAAGLPVAPPSYEGRLEIHPRSIDGEIRTAIDLDSIGSSANRVEEVLQELYENGQYPLPVSSTTVTPSHGGDPIKITTLQAPHRLFDAWIRLSADPDGDPTTAFEDSSRGQELSRAHLSALDPILESSAHDLLFGTWDSHRKGPNGQVRVARALTTSLIGLDPTPQARFAARRDPLNLGEASNTGSGKTLSAQGLSSIPPQKSIPYEEHADGTLNTFGATKVDHRGDVSIASARFQGFLSFAALRRLGFARYDAVDARVVLAALALYGVALRSAAGWDLRARCALVPRGPLELQVVGGDGTRTPVALSVTDARALFDESVVRLGLEDRSVHLDAGPVLNKLVADSVTSAK